MADKEKCECCEAPVLVFPCSGASDVGEIADRAGRKMKRDGTGSMYCLAGIGGRVSGIVKSTQAAKRVLAIDGCATDCARKCLELAGVKNILHLRASDLGLKKGKSEVSEENVAAVAEKARAMLGCEGRCSE